MTLEVTVEKKCPVCRFKMRWVGYWSCFNCNYREFGGCCGD